MVTTDSNGINWFVATGQQGRIAQSRDQANDYRWSGNVSGSGEFGIEVTAYFAFQNVDSGGHFALKHAGPNHSGCTDEDECAWYDTGIRSNGNVQLQIERPHPNNDTVSFPTTMSNIGMGMDGNRIGLKWIAYPKIRNGSPDSGGYVLKMYVDTSGFNSSGRPQNQWRLVYNYTDNGDILGNYQPPNTWDVEIRVSDTDEVDDYAGGLHWRKLGPTDAANDTGNTGGGGTPPPSNGNNIDPFGCKMIYPTKVDEFDNKGEEWFQDNDPENDGRLLSGSEVITRNGDYFTNTLGNNGNVLIVVLTSMGEAFTECNVNYSQLQNNEFIFTDRDWKNVEVTFFAYPQEIDPNTANANFALNIRRSQDTNSDIGNTSCCSDYGYYAVFNIAQSGEDLAGTVRFNKQLDATLTRGDNISQSVKNSFYRSWTGFKFIVYNIQDPNNNENWVQLEIWMCPSDSATDRASNWTKIHSFIDKGDNFGVGGNNCGGSAAQAITWGTTFVGLNYAHEPEIRWKHWSVREIDPLGEFPSDPTDPPPPPPDGEEPSPCEESPSPSPSPTPTTPTLYRFLSWGDNDTTTAARNVLTQMFTEQNIAQFLFAGDGPYSEDSDEWIDMMSEYFSTTELKRKLMLAQGNHEHPESESQRSEDQIEQWMSDVVQLNNSVEGLEWLQAKKVGNAYIIVMNSQDPDIDEIGGDQYNYVQSKLNEAKSLRNQGEIDWIITMVHKSWFNLLGSNPSYVTARHAYAQLFRDAQVDFMFHGHNHSYAIWRPIVAIPGDDENTSAQALFTLTADGKYDMSGDTGTFYIINGNGGHEINNWGEDPNDFPNILYANDNDFGYTVLDIQGKQATITAKDVNGNVLFTVQATRGTDVGGDTPPSNALDEFGIKKLYSTKGGGEEWFIDNNPEADPQLGSTEETITAVSDYFVVQNIAEPNEILMNVKTTDASPSVNCSVSYSQLISQGFRNTSKDWRNSETTIFINPQDVGDLTDGFFTMTARAGNGDGTPSCCDNYLYGAVIYFADSGNNAGRVQFMKRLAGNTQGSASVIQTAKTHFYQSWTGFKFVVYNQSDGRVRLELWVCPSDSSTDISNSWTRVFSFLDNGLEVGQDGDLCNGAVAQKISWGSYHQTIFYVANELRFKWWSIREIDPLAPAPQDPLPPPGNQDPCEEPPPPPPPESVFNDLVLVYNVNSDSDGCICNEPPFTPPPPGEEPCPTGQQRNPETGLCEDVSQPPPPPPGGGGSGGETQSIYDIGFSGPDPDDIRMASESGSSSFYLKFGAWIRGTGSPLYNKDIKRIEWPLRKRNNPTGNASVVIRRGSDNSIAKSFGTIDVQDLTTSTEYQGFENTTTSYITQNGDRILLEYSGGDDNDYIVAWAVDGQSNDTKVTKQDNTQDDDEYRDRDQEASFRAFA